MELRRLGQTDLLVSPIGFGAFKIGRNVGIKYPAGYELPDDEQTARLLNGVLDLGINLIDTAPAYGVSEQRIGACLAHRRSEFILSTKAGEIFENGQSRYDFSGESIQHSVERSLRKLRTDVIDILFIHSDGNDLDIIERTDAIETLSDLRKAGQVRFLGFSGKTQEGFRAAIPRFDVLMVEYNAQSRELESIIEEAARYGVGVVVKKGLGSGHLDPAEAIPLVLRNPHVASMVIGGLNLDHLRTNVETATRCVDR